MKMKLKVILLTGWAFLLLTGWAFLPEDFLYEVPIRAEYKTIPYIWAMIGSCVLFLLALESLFRLFDNMINKKDKSIDESQVK